jgi:hypothetical protein
MHTTTKVVELDARIENFLEKKMAKFPDLHQEDRPKKDEVLARFSPRTPTLTVRWNP